MNDDTELFLRVIEDTGEIPTFDSLISSPQPRPCPAVRPTWAGVATAYVLGVLTVLLPLAVVR